MSKHVRLHPHAHTVRLTAKIPVKFTFPGLAEGERETANITVDIEYTHTVTSKRVYTVELDLISATLVDGDGLDPTDGQVKEWASDWLDDAGYDVACQHAENCMADLCGNLD